MDNINGINKFFDLAVKVEALFCPSCSIIYNNILIDKCFWCLGELKGTYFYIVSDGLKVGTKIIDTTQIGKKDVTQVIGKGKIIDGTATPQV